MGQDQNNKSEAIIKEWTEHVVKNKGLVVCMVVIVNGQIQTLQVDDLGKADMATMFENLAKAYRDPKIATYDHRKNKNDNPEAKA